MSAAMEGAIEWIPAVGFSLCDDGPDSDFSHTIVPIRQIAQRLLKNGLPKGVVLNVNIPKRQKQPIKGIRVCRQTDGYWKEVFNLVGDNADLKPDLKMPQEFILSGHFVNRDTGAQDNDIWALENNYISVVPAQYDLTAYDALVTLQEEWNADH
jgi:5'-nucleotidase